MDKKILKWGRQILRLTPTFPAAVLSSPHLLQLPMPSDAIQTSQLRCFWRSQHRGPRQADVTNRLLHRALHTQANCTTNPHAATPLQATHATTSHRTLWAHTIAKIYADSGLAICKPPTDTPIGPPSITHNYPTLTPVADQLHQHALTTVGDLHTGQGWMALNHFPEALQPHLQPVLQGPPQPNPDRSPHPGQFWHLSPTPPQHPARTIYEILPDPDPHGTQYARPWLTMNPHSHLNPVPDDTYYWPP